MGAEAVVVMTAAKMRTRRTMSSRRLVQQQFQTRTHRESSILPGFSAGGFGWADYGCRSLRCPISAAACDTCPLRSGSRYSERPAAPFFVHWHVSGAIFLV